jgi:RNA recognition motif. (a.k.a. RRM, RBD, or RNP domain)
MLERLGAVRYLQGLELDGHKLLIQLSQRKRLADDDKKGGKATAGGKANTTKLVCHCLLKHFPLLARCCTAAASMAQAGRGVKAKHLTLLPLLPMLIVCRSFRMCRHLRLASSSLTRAATWRFLLLPIAQVVRNVAFEATRKDLVGLFGPFGHIKSARLPRKFDGNHRSLMC